MTKRSILLVVSLLLPGAAPAADAVSGATHSATGGVRCDSCHGPAGASTNPQVPIIGGVSAAFLSTALWAYQDGAWPCGGSRGNPGDATIAIDHCQIARGLTTGQITALAGHYAKQPFVAARQETDAAQVARGRALHVAHCAKCHTDNGANPADDAGILAGQWIPALRAIFGDYLDGKRSQPKAMKTKMDKLGQGDVEALLQFYASAGPGP